MMNKNENLDPEPPELVQQGVPPLKRIVKYIFNSQIKIEKHITEALRILKELN